MLVGTHAYGDVYTTRQRCLKQIVRAKPRLAASLLRVVSERAEWVPLEI